MISLGLMAAGGVSRLFGNRRRRRQQRREGRRLAGIHRQNAHDARQQGMEHIQDIRREGDQVLGAAQHLWGASGARISGDRAELGTDDIDIGTFDREGWMDEQRSAIEGQLQTLAENRDPHEDDSSSGIDRRENALRAQLRNLDRHADEAEEQWGRNLRDQELPDLEADINRRVRDGDGTLAAIQNSSLANIERDILRTVGQTRRAMSAEYEGAAAARRSGEQQGGFLEDLGTILGTAGDMFSTYQGWQQLQPNRGTTGAGRPGGGGIFSPQEYRRRNYTPTHFSFFGP